MREYLASLRLVVGRLAVEGYGRALSALFLTAIMVAVGAQAQTKAGVRCTGGRKLLLDTLTRLIQVATKEQVVVNQIEACHVSFSLDAPSLNKLVNVGVTDSEMDALNHDTVTQLSAEAARSEVADLEAHVTGVDAKAQGVFRARVEFLKKADYSVAGPVILGDWSPSTQVLGARIAGEEYQFDGVPADTVRQLKAELTHVAVVRPYAEDERKTRFLRLSSAQIDISGSSKAAIAASRKRVIARILDEGRERAARKDYDNAIASYTKLQELDPGNADSSAGLAAVQKAKEQDASTAAEDRQHNVWRDLDTGLMWMLKDNGAGINPQHAAEYCRNLHTASFSDWRTASILELLTIYNNSDTGSTQASTGGTSPAQASPGAARPYHTKGGITLTATLVLSSDESDTSAGPRARAFNFATGNNNTVYSQANERLFRALCVRRTAGTTISGDSAQSPISSSNDRGNDPGEAFPADPNAADEVAQMKALSEDKQFRRSFTLGETLCDEGNQEGCALVGSMYLTGWGGVEPDETRGSGMIIRACYAGNIDGCATLGQAYMFGLSVTKDFQRAADLLTRACDGDSSSGCGNLAFLYFEGRGVPQDRNKAMELYRKACSLGSDKSCQILERLRPQLGQQPQPRDGSANSGPTPPVDLAEVTRKATVLYDSKRFADAAPLYEKTCADGNLYDCNRLGFMYMNGQGVVVMRRSIMPVSPTQPVCNTFAVNKAALGRHPHTV